MDVFNLQATITINKDEYERRLADAVKGFRACGDLAKKGGAFVKNFSDSLGTIRTTGKATQKAVERLADSFSVSAVTGKAASLEAQNLSEQLTMAENNATDFKETTEAVTTATKKQKAAFIDLIAQYSSSEAAAESFSDKAMAAFDVLRILGSATDTAANKASVLRTRYAAAQSEVERLTAAFNRSASESGVTSKETQRLADKLEAAEKDAGRLEKELKDLTGSMDAAGGAARGLGDATDGAGKSMGGLDGFARGASDALGLTQIASAGAAFTIGLKLVEAVADAAKWLLELDERTEEYRVAIGKLNTAFEVAGFNADTAMEAYQEFYRILGDTDTAAEASQLLAKLADSEEDVARWINISAGA